MSSLLAITNLHLLAGGATTTSTSQDVSKGDVDHSARGRGVDGSTGTGLGSRGRGTSAGSTAGTSACRRASIVGLALKGAETSDRVEGAQVALFASVDDTVTTSWLNTAGSATVGDECVILSFITLLRTLDDTVTTDGTSVGGPRDRTAIERLSSTYIGEVKDSSKDGELSGRDGLRFGKNVPRGSFRAGRSGDRAPVGCNRRASLVEDMSKIKERSRTGATGVRKASSGAAGRDKVVVGGGGDSTLVTELTIFIIDDIIATEREHAIGSAAIG